MTFKQRLNRFITAGFEHGDDIFLLRRLVLVTSLLSMIIFLFSFFTIYNLYTGNTETGWLDISGAITGLTAMYQLQRHKRLNLAINLVVLLLFSFLLLFAYINQNHSYGLIWTFFFPVFTVLLKGHRTGTLLVIAFYSVLLPSAFFGIGHWQDGQWDLTSFFRFSLALLVIYYSAYFNELSLQRSYNELHKTNRREQEAARQHTEEVMQLLENKKQLMADISHDLRQPLNSIGLFLYGLKQKLQGDNSALQLAEKIGSAHQGLSDMFSALLEISNADAGKIKANAKLTKPSDIVQSVVDELTGSATGKGIEIHHTSSDVWMITDEILLSRIVRNLLGNAIKYTKQGHIEVTETINQQRLNIAITDTGIGIPEEELDNIFDEYYQIGNKRRDRNEGVGLGLSITKRLCDLLGYEISVTSTEDVGSCFTITLPLTETQAKTTEAESFSEQPNLNNLHVLVIDDAPDILAGMRLVLEGWQCHVNTASSYHQASAAINAKVPDLILCDYRLQDDMTGPDVLHKLEQQCGKPIPAIIISGEHLAVVEAELQQMDYPLLSKPVQPSQLYVAIAGLFH